MAFILPYQPKNMRAPLATAYYRIIEVNLNFFAKVGRVVFAIYADKESRAEGLQDLDSLGFAIGPAAQVIKAAVYQQDEEGNDVLDEAGNKIEIEPAITFPGFDAIVNAITIAPEHAGMHLFDLARAGLYQLFKQTRGDIFGNAKDDV